MRNKASIHPISFVLLALVAGCDAESHPRTATVERIDAQPFPEPLPITDGGSGDGGGSESGGSDTDSTETCEPLDPELHGLVLAQDYELPPGTDVLLCDDDNDPEFDDEGTEPIGAWQPWGGCGVMADITGYMPPPAVFEVDCKDLVGVKVTPDESKGKDQRVCKELMDASNKCIDDARKQCDAYAAGKNGKPNFKVTYKYQNECYFSKAKRTSNWGPIGVFCEGTIDRDADWTCDVTPVG